MEIPSLPKSIEQALAENEVIVKPLFSSSLTKIKGRDLFYRGKKVSTLIKQGVPLEQAVVFLWTGKSPTKKETELIRRLILYVLDHGPANAGALATITAASAGKGLSESVAAGLLMIGPKFGGAAGEAARCFTHAVEYKMSPEDFFDYMRKINQPMIPGFGHRIYNYQNPDPRIRELIKFTQKNFKKTPVLDFALETEKELLKKKDNLILNIDGFIGAVLSDLGYDTQTIDAFFLYARTAGLIAHYLEQKKKGTPLIRLPEWLVRELE